MASPVHVGEEYDVTIDTVGSKGDGVAKIKGYVVFVKNVQEGDKIKIRITKTLEKVGFGEQVTSAPKEEAKEEAKEEVSEKKSKKSSESEEEMDEEPEAEPAPEEDEEDMPEA